MTTGQWYQCPSVAERASAEGYATSCVAFDPYYELLWTGGQNGSLTSYVVDVYDEAVLQRYTTAWAHQADIRQLLPIENGIVSLAADELRYTKRGGVRISSFRSDRLNELQCMLPTSGSMTTFYVGALDGSLSIIDLARTRLLREEALDHGIGVLKAAGDGDGGRGRSGLLACGQTNGQVVLRDMVTLRAEHILDAHTAAISDVEAHDNMLVTCGFSARLGNYVVDPVIKVYDIRTMKVVNMLQFPAGPALLKFLPGQAGQLCAASQSGHFTVFDAQTVGAGSPYLYAVDTQGAMLTAVDASSSGGFLAFADSAGLLHPWTIDDPAGATVNAAGASRDIEYPDDVEVDVGVDLMDAGMPLALVPMLYKYTGEPLLSDWPASLAVPARRPPLPLDAHVAATMKMVDFVGYASNPGTRLRNQAEYVPGQGMRRDASESIFTRVARAFRRKDITYTRLGMEEFDFGAHNRTGYSGLEAHSPNAYCNPLLQTWYHVEPVRSLLLDHLCTKDNCLACELAFFFHMVDLAEGANCVPGNFVRTLRATPQALALGLVLTGDEKKPDYAKLVQDSNRFLLNHMAQEAATATGTGTGTGISLALAPLFTTKTSAVSRCHACGHEARRALDTLFIDLVYPPDEQLRAAPPTFAGLLQGSVERETEARAWCEACQAYKPSVSRRVAEALPDILAVGCQARTPTELGLWHAEDGTDNAFLPPALSVALDGDRLAIAPAAGEARDDDPDRYELVAVIVYVSDDVAGGNVVAEIKGAHGWHVFNDFAVSGLSEAEALHFNTAWKIPCVLYYARPGAAARHPLAPPGHTHPIPADVLCDDAPYIARLPRRPSTAPRTFVPLAADQVPGAGYHVAIDAEFVALHMEEAAIRSDGTKSTLKPSQLCLARVSALHGEAPRFGQAFLDDYIATTEPVADYLTQYSGIHPGDLDPGVSTKHLVTLKATYLKLRCLADRGVVFVGHGLKKDFGIINMVVPKAQIVDTVDLFYMPRQRRISLRFLAWFLLNIDVQGGNHDSIEDARTALYLWDKYRQLVRDGELDKTLKDLYEAGRRYKWKAPHWVS